MGQTYSEKYIQRFSKNPEWKRRFENSSVDGEKNVNMYIREIGVCV
jgi:hypothetical protein